MGQEYVWNAARPRDQRLKPGGPKRIVAIDGGGIRGLISCGILKSVEDTLRNRLPAGPARDAFVLSDYYDLIVGTSTGAIIAVWLALGKRVQDLQDLYMDLGPSVFGRRRLTGTFFVNRFDGALLDQELRSHLGDKTLDTYDLLTGFGVTAKRMDTGSGWLIANNPRAPYYSGVPEAHPNADYLLRHVVRASAAAPAYFDHVKVDIERDGAPGAFMDGAVAGMNNPSLAYFLYATTPGYGLDWATGPEKLLITSVGTGEYRQRFTAQKLDQMAALESVVRSLAGSIQDVAKIQLMMLQAMSRPARAYPINTEWDALASAEERAAGQGHSFSILSQPLFSFQRYDVQLESSPLAKQGFTYNGHPYSTPIMRQLQALDCAKLANLLRLKEIGEMTGRTGVRGEDFPAAFDTAAMGAGAQTPAA